MAEFPCLPLWTDRYLADTRHLSTLEHGAYLLLLMEAWRRPSCALPDDDILLSRLVSLDVAAWRAIKPAIMGFWTLDGRRKEWVQKGLRKEREYVSQSRQRQRDRALKRWHGEEKTYAAAMQPCNAPTPTPTPVEKRETNVSPKKSRGSRLPDDWTLPDEWRAWAESEGVPPQHIEDQAKRFANYWQALSGQKATKLDWYKTWQNWVLNARGVPRVRAIEGGSHETEQQRAYREARERRAAIAERMDRERGGGA